MRPCFSACIVALCLLLSGCRPSATTSPVSSPPQAAAVANQLFLNQKTFDPWVLKRFTPDQTLPAYISDGHDGLVYDALGNLKQYFKAGAYLNGILAPQPLTHQYDTKTVDEIGSASGGSRSKYAQILDMRTGACYMFTGGDYDPMPVTKFDGLRLWQTSDIIINGDPEAQQVTHANLFYLLSSTYPGSDHSIPPMGLSSNVYGGHIFWDAEVWMLPALIVQHPEYARPIVDYRFKLLTQAKKNAKAHGLAGAEFPWESADTGAEMAPGDFAKERHITADVGWAVWQYYLWTGNKLYLKEEGWPILQATAQYWASRVAKGPDGRYHISRVMSPDETAGLVDDDAYTNAVVQANLRAATRAAKLIGQSADPRWSVIADALFFPYDTQRGIPAEHSGPMTDRFAAKQADTLLLIHPLNGRFDAATAGRMLDFYQSHTIKSGPAMTASIHAIVAAKLGRSQQSLDLFHASYRPFERGPWDAFSEKRTTNNVYFLTGMAGCVQTVLYGFAGLKVSEAGEPRSGTKIAGDSEASLYADPHLPPGWGPLTVKGIRFRGQMFDVIVSAGNKVTVKIAP